MVAGATITSGELQRAPVEGASGKVSRSSARLSPTLSAILAQDSTKLLRALNVLGSLAFFILAYAARTQPAPQAKGRESNARHGRR